MSGIVWRWEEKDLGFRFRGGKGKRVAEYYQARKAGEYYTIPASQRKLKKGRVDALAKLVKPPTSPRVVANPWRDYHLDYDAVESDDYICLNWAGCLDKEEIKRREDEGVQRALELVTGLAERDEPAPLTIDLIRQVHTELMGEIYPFAGNWRTVPLHKGEGPTKWPLPPGGIQPQMDLLARDVLSRSPLLTDEDDQVFGYASEVMNDVLAIHPFREGNGRTAFMLGNLLLMQNSMLPLNVYNRREDEERYLAACEAGRIHRDYAPLAALLQEWEDQTIAQWEANHG